MSGYVLSEDADLDLDDIWAYIAQDNIDASDRWIGKLFDAFEQSDGHRASVKNAKTLPTNFPSAKLQKFACSSVRPSGCAGLPALLFCDANFCDQFNVKGVGSSAFVERFRATMLEATQS
jgi:hypothetical protein